MCIISKPTLLSEWRKTLRHLSLSRLRIVPCEAYYLTVMVSTEAQKATKTRIPRQFIHRPASLLWPVERQWARRGAVEKAWPRTEFTIQENDQGWALNFHITNRWQTSKGVSCFVVGMGLVNGCWTKTWWHRRCNSVNNSCLMWAVGPWITAESERGRQAGQAERDARKVALPSTYLDTLATSTNEREQYEINVPEWHFILLLTHSLNVVSGLCSGTGIWTAPNFWWCGRIG